MRGTREIKRRIRSVQSTQKITKAMEMVAAAKLRRAQERAESGRPYTQSIINSIARILKHTRAQNALMEKKESPVKCFMVVTSDRGLCGSYNSNVMRRALTDIQQLPRDQVTIIAIGRKARDFFKRREYNIVAEYLNIDDRPDFSLAQEMGSMVARMFLEGQIGEAGIFYSEFINVVIHRPQLFQLLPMQAEQIEEEEAEAAESAAEKGEEQDKLFYRFEPEPEAVLGALLPRFLNSLIYSALLESKASEFGARMTAMRTATDNARDMIERLTLEYNKARQAAITQEILEIVNTSEALSGS